MADSHGEPEAIATGAIFLRRRACTSLYHLGDICDSTLPKTADDCVAQVKKHGIVAIKGNNDHTLTADTWRRSDRSIRRETIAFLENLPLCLSVGSATLVHSRPFVRRLGLSAMIGVMGQREAENFFRENPGGLLFRGHSHKPEIISRRGKEIRFFSPTAGLVIELAEHRPCIVTCGALTSGFALIWEPETHRLAFCTIT